MKISFKCLAMPENVEFKTTLKNQPKEVLLRILKNGRLYTVTADGDAGYDCGTPDCYGPVISSKPVPLNTLEPFPVWYWSNNLESFLAHNGADGVFTPDRLFNPKGASKIDVIPNPFVMEIDDVTQ